MPGRNTHDAPTTNESTAPAVLPFPDRQPPAKTGRLPKSWTDRPRRLLVVGATTSARELMRLLRLRPHWRVAIAGLVATDVVKTAALDGVPVVGRPDDVGTLLDTMDFDEVVMADPNVDQRHLDSVAGACLERGVTYHTLVRMPGRVAADHNAEALGNGLYLISMESTRPRPLAFIAKRVVDIVCALAGLVACAVAFVIFAPLIRLGSPGPALFRQTRVGKNGRRFTLYKLRTMQADAETQKAALMAANEMSGHLFKIRDDPRVTPIGHFLRRTYLDELPQFWNVLKGDMSLVGTRPPTPDEVACYSPHHRRRLSVRPGITGLWQSMGNGKVWDFEVVVKLDCEYIDRWSPWLDSQIIARTILVVARGAGH
jgi:exopolysaccharide biosynthesis polyprenyl glycosylphosphotransferase